MALCSLMKAYISREQKLYYIPISLTPRQDLIHFVYLVFMLCLSGDFSVYLGEHQSPHLCCIEFFSFGRKSLTQQRLLKPQGFWKCVLPSYMSHTDTLPLN